MTNCVLVALLLAAFFIIVLQWHRHRKTIDKVMFLFNAIDNGDSTFRFSTTRRNDALLNAALNRIKDILQHARDEQIQREKYYEVILDQIATGIVVADTERNIIIRSNRAARRMLGRDVITHLDQVSGRMKAYAIRETFAELKGRRVKIIAMSDIHGELANQEVDAWVKLIRVLTHEIMNALTPVISLTQTLLPDATGATREGLDTINRTSRQLVAFVESYRQFTHVPKPNPQLFYVRPFLKRMATLANEWLKANCNIDATTEPRDLLVFADEGLVERVIANLLKNAAEAAPEGGHLWLKAYTDKHDAVVIDVANDGERIPDDIAAQIFTPFFTTKKDGNGIGLSISRQIMRNMGGMLELVRDEPITTFRLTFP